MNRKRLLALMLALLVSVILATGAALVRGSGGESLERTIPLVGYPVALAVDPRSGHVFVVNGYNFTGRSFSTAGFGGSGQGLPGAGYGGTLYPGGTNNAGSRGGQSFSSTYSIGGSPGSGDSIGILDARSGRLSHTVQVGADPRDVAVDPARGLVLVSNDDDASVSVLDAANGGMIRQISVGSHPHTLVADPRTGHLFVVNTGDGTVAMMADRSGARLRILRLPSASVRAGLGLDSHAGRIFVSGAGALSIVDARTGAVQRTVPDVGEVIAMAVDEQRGRLYVLGPAGLRVYDERTGHLRRTLPVGVTPVAVAVDQQSGRVFVVSGGDDRSGKPAGPGSLQVFDGQRGVLLRTLPVGVAPTAVAFDARNRQVLVADGGGDAPVTDPWGWIPGWMRHAVPFLSSPGASRRAEPSSLTLIDARRL